MKKEMTIKDAFDFALERHKNGDLKKAEEIYREILKTNPEHLNSLISLSEILSRKTFFEEAIELLKRVIEINPALVQFHKDLGLLLERQGKTEEALKSFRNALSYNPNYIEAYFGITRIKKIDSLEDEDLKALLSLLESADLNERSLALLHFSLGKIYDDCKKYDKAFFHYHKGNRIRKGSRIFNIKETVDRSNQTINQFSKKFFDENNIEGNPSELPVFIVGMFRSGTSLIEQIISSHPKVSGAGELLEMHKINKSIANKINKKNVEEKAAEYLEFIKHGVDENILRVSDKMPYNFINLGLIAVLFPNAKIIHCKRDPMDTCLSNYFHFFANKNEPSYDLVDIGEFFKEYQRVMDHWRKVLPLKIYDIQYEDLIKNKETETKGLIEFLGLKWDDKCLESHKNKRNVNTASAWQVRQPIYKDSVARWKNYEKYLPLLKETLEGKL